MIPTTRIVSWLWLPALVIALTFVAWRGHLGYSAGVKLQQVTGGAVRESAPSHESITGYADGARRLINRSGDAVSLQLVVAVQARLAGAPFRDGVVQSENTPEERLSRSSLLYREWLVVLSRVDHAITGLPLGICAEGVALYAGPLEHGLFVIVGTFLSWLAFGRLSAAAAALALAGGFPLAEAFVATSPGVSGALVATWFVSSCLLSRAIRMTSESAGTRGRRWAVSAGVVGALGFDFDAATSVWVLFGVVIGGVLAALTRQKDSSGIVIWRAWGWAGGITTLVYYMVGYASGSWSWSMEAIHPLHAAFWLGCAELLHGVAAWKAGQRRPRIQYVGTTIGLVAVVIPLVFVFQLPHGAFWAGPALSAWWADSGFQVGAWAVVLSVVTACGAGVAAFRRGGATWQGWLVAMGPVLVTLTLVGVSLSWLLVACTLALVSTIAGLTTTSAGSVSSVSMEMAPGSVLSRAVFLGLAASCLVGGAAGIPNRDATGSVELSTLDAGWLQARDIGHWLRRREGSAQATVLVSPSMGAQVAFSGNLRDVSGAVRGNSAGMLSTVRTFSATSPDEALELLTARGVKYIVLPAMDPSLETLLSAGSGVVPPTTFYAAIGRWEQPAWMYPLAYVPPPVFGVEDYAVRLFEVGSLQPDATAWARLAEYFVETGNPTLAGVVARRLEPHDSDLGALAARALVSLAQKNSEGFQRHLGAIVPLVDAGMSGYVPWEQRITLALILAQGKQSTLLKAEMGALVTEADEARLRALSHTVLLRFIKLCKLAGTPLADPALEKLVLDLLPEEARAKL